MTETKCPTCGNKWSAICSDGFHAQQIPKCPTCGRRPSERRGDSECSRLTGDRFEPDCPDPCHDAADLGPAAVELLREWSAAGESMAWEQRVDALLAAAEVKPVRPNHADGCTMQQGRYLGTGYDRVRKCECGAEDHAPEVKP